MISAITAFAIALLIAVATTPIVRSVALAVGAVDRPSTRRVHGRVIPRLGGVAIVVAFFVPLLALFAVETQAGRLLFAEPGRVIGLIAGGLIVSVLGVFDDLRGLRAWTKLGVQFGAATVAFACGYRIDAIAVPFIGQLDMGIFALPVTALWIAAIVNAINLIDGLDGLAGGVAFFACVTNFVVGWINHDGLVMLLSASLGGAVLGFLLYNFNPASIFMGDSGSLFLGYVLATTSILGSSVKSSTTVAIFVPLIALGLPIMDTLFAMVRRFLERRPIFAPDRGHIHHRLLAMGINHRRAVLTLYGLSILFTIGAILISTGRNWQVGGALLVLSLAVIGVVRAMGNLNASVLGWRRRERVRGATAERLRVAVPRALARVAAVREFGEMRPLLDEFAAGAELLTLELVDSESEALPSFVWRPEPAVEVKRQSLHGAGRDIVSASYPVRAIGANASLRFVWVSDHSEVSPEADILLQLIADAVEARVARGEDSRISVAKGQHLRSV